MSDAETTLSELHARLLALGHAMQTGVAYTMSIDPGETTPKHLRVGVNNAMIGVAAIADLLIQKGIFTEEEYVRSLITWTERDIASYQATLGQMYPDTKITLV